VGVAVLVTILGTRVDVGSVDDFRLAWALGAALSLGTSVVGALLMRTRKTAPVVEPEYAAKA
jgi:hypothetical protein